MSPDILYFVDATYSFGGMPVDIESSQIDFLVTSSGQCLQGVPGLGLVLCKKERLVDAQGEALLASNDKTAIYFVSFLVAFLRVFPTSKEKGFFFCIQYFN